MKSNLRSVAFIYASKIIAFAVNSLSVIIVVPYVASVPEHYAIYMFALSLTFILTYGDLGFLSAAQKYCATSVGAEQFDTEIKDVGYVLALLLSIGFIFLIIMVFGSVNPSLFIPSLEAESKKLASSIFLIIGIMMPIQVLLQRLANLILASRLKEYIFVFLDIIANVAKVIIVPYFELSSGFALELYLISSISLSISAAFLSLLLIKIFTNFDLLILFRFIRFTRSSFDKMKALALSSILSTIFFILTFELDLVIAARLFSLESIAIYALALTLINFIRNSSSVIYAPIIAFVNRDLGAGHKEKVLRNFQEIIEFSLSLFITLVLVIYLSAEPLIVQWLGYENVLIAEIFQVMLIGSIFVSLSNLLPLVATTYEHKTQLIIAGGIPFVAFYVFLLSTLNFYDDFSIMTLAYAKAIALMSSAVFALLYFKKVLIFTFNQLKVMLCCCISAYVLFLILDFFIHPAYTEFLATDIELVTLLAMLLMGVVFIWIFLLCLIETTRSKFIRLCRRVATLNL